MISRRFLRFLLLGCILSLALVAGGMWLSWQEYRTYASLNTTVTTIPKGMGTVRISELLESLGVISSARWFVVHYKLAREGAMQAGEYRFESGEDPWQVMQRVVRGEVVQHRLVIPEGLTLREIAKEMANRGVAGATALLDDPALVSQLGVDATTLEGWLFPDTYFFRRDVSPLELVRRMTERSRRVVMQESGGRDKEVTLTPYQGLILASIVEKETGVAAERQHIAGVFHNRLKRKMRLQSDPTVIYGLSNFSGDITRNDLVTPTLFNTYTIDGLPPSPICNPGQASIHAAFHPEKTDDLYFVATGDGGHVFSKTLAEHQRAVKQYRKRLKEIEKNERSP